MIHRIVADYRINRQVAVVALDALDSTTRPGGRQARVRPHPICDGSRCAVESSGVYRRDDRIVEAVLLRETQW